MILRILVWRIIIIHTFIVFGWMRRVCLTKLLLSLNAMSHELHLKGRSWEWILLWTTKLLLVENAMSHELHLKGFSFVWILSWTTKLPFEANAMSHELHLKGRSWEWILSCLTKLLLEVNEMSHELHLKGRSFVWTTKWAFLVNVLLHVWHLFSFSLFNDWFLSFFLVTKHDSLGGIVATALRTTLGTTSFNENSVSTSVWDSLDSICSDLIVSLRGLNFANFFAFNREINFWWIWVDDFPLRKLFKVDFLLKLFRILLFKDKRWWPLSYLFFWLVN
jgi:hypothetical protein